MNRLYRIAITITLLALIHPPRLVEAACTGGSLCTGSTYYKKGVEEIGKVWYLTVFAGTTPPEVLSNVFGIESNLTQPGPQYVLSDTVRGFLTCVQEVCIRNPDKPQCSVPGDNNGTPYQVQEGDFFLSSESTTCLVKGQKGTCKVLGYDHILNAEIDGNPCPGGFVPDFSPDPFIGRTSTCDVSRGTLVTTTEPPTCSLDNQPATSLCMLVSGLPLAIGEPYANQTEIPNDGTIISTDEYAALGCTPNTLRGN